MFSFINPKDMQVLPLSILTAIKVNVPLRCKTPDAHIHRSWSRNTSHEVPNRRELNVAMELVSTIFTIVLYFFGTCFGIIHLPMVIPESWQLRYYMLNVAYMMAATFILSFYLFLLLFVSIEESMRICTSLTLKWITRMGLDVRTAKNANLLHETGNAVIVVNHQSFFDPFLWDKMAFSTMVYGGSELSNHIFLRKAVATQAHKFLDRGCKRSAMKTLMMSSEEHFKKDKQNKVLIFPEGERNTRMKDYTFLEFKQGAFRVAKSCNVPVIPVVISPLYFIDHQQHYFKKGKTIISVLQPVYPAEMEVGEFAEKVKGMMQEEFIKLKEQLVDGKPPSTLEYHHDKCDSSKNELVN